MGVDLKKEIKLSDLFRHGRKEPAPDAPAPAPEKERRSLFRRQADGQPPRERKERRSLRRRREPNPGPAAGAGRTAAALPDIPLMRAFNLLPKEEADAREGRLQLSYVLVALFGVLTVAGLAAAFFFTSAQVSERQAERDELKVRLAALAAPTQAPAGEAELVQERADRTGALARALSARVPWDRVLREFSLVLPDDVFLESLVAQTPASQAAAAAPADPNATGSVNSFTIVGCADEQDTVAELLARLSTIPEFASVQLVSSAVTPSDCGRPVLFTVGATVKPRAPA